MAEPIRWNWAIGENEFLMRIGELEAFDDLTTDGALDFRARLVEGHERGGLDRARVKVREVEHCIRLGLIGGGMERKEAERHARRASDEVDITNRNLLCLTILTKAFSGKEHDPVGETKAGEASQGSASPASTGTEPRSGSRQRKSKK